jgi:hypothetical protein
MPNDKALRRHLTALFSSEAAHVNFDAAVTNFPAEFQDKQPANAAHTPWQVLEHMRITQRDVVDRIGNASHRALNFPDEYWPPAASPRKSESWDASVTAFRADQKVLLDVISEADLFNRARPGSNGLLLGDLLMIADHNAYHLGELILLRRLLGAWS